MSRHGGHLPGGPEFDEDCWCNNPMDGLYDHDTLLGYMLQGSDQLQGWNCNEISDLVLVRLLEMGLWDGVRATLHPDAPAALELSIAHTRVLDCL